MSDVNQGGKYTAIIIDDESWTRDVLRYLGKWEELGIEIIAEASDGAFGLELAMNLEPDIILSDVRMPNMDGLALLRILRQRGCRSKLLYVSGYDDFEYVRSAMQLRASDYLLKPIKPEELNRQLAVCVSELNGEREPGRAKGLNPQIILHKPWFEEYVGLKQRIAEALRGNNLKLLDGQMSRLEQLIIAREGEELLSDIAIYIYFDFHTILHRFIADSGYSLRDFFDAKTGTYVFGGLFSFSEMMRVIAAGFHRALERSEQLRKEQNRLDIAAVRRYVQASYAENITLEQTADRFYVSKEYLSKLFKAETGMGFQGYLTALRMDKARQLLLTGNTLIREIVEITGYREPGHFYKVFKKYYGITPGEMLQAVRDTEK